MYYVFHFLFCLFVALIFNIVASFDLFVYFLDSFKYFYFNCGRF